MAATIQAMIETKRELANSPIFERQRAGNGGVSLAIKVARQLQAIVEENVLVITRVGDPGAGRDEEKNGHEKEAALEEREVRRQTAFRSPGQDSCVSNHVGLLFESRRSERSSSQLGI